MQARPSHEAPVELDHRRRRRVQLVARHPIACPRRTSSARRPLGSRSSAIAPASASTSRGSTKAAASPSTSGSAPAAPATTGTRSAASPRGAGTRTLRRARDRRTRSRRRAGRPDARRRRSRVWTTRCACRRGVDRRLDPRRVPARRTRQDEAELRIGRREPVEGTHEGRQVLARLDRAEREDVPFRAGGAAPAAGSPAGTAGTPEWMATTRSAVRSGSARAPPRRPTLLGVCTVAPRSMARCRMAGYRSVSAVQSSGKRMKVTSWTVTTTGARAGGATKLVACTTSTGPVQSSARGRVSPRSQHPRTTVAGMGRVAASTPRGTAAESCDRPRQVRACTVAATRPHAARAP